LTRPASARACGLVIFLSSFIFSSRFGGVTHRDLFLGSPVKLPFLNVDLPLLGFF
jgi:hypothetical protein